MPITIQNSHFLDCIKTGDMIEINLKTNQIVIHGETLNMAPIGELASIVSAGGYLPMLDKMKKCRAFIKP